MCKDMSRALRRHHRERLKKNRKNYWGYGQQGWRTAETEMSEATAGIVINTPTPCSCWMCGNPRKAWCEITMQEKKALDNYKNNMEEIYGS